MRLMICLCTLSGTHEVAGGGVFELRVFILNPKGYGWQAIWGVFALQGVAGTCTGDTAV